ncbi:MAG: DUF3789 domain-containing protein [Oscillospiraceae bacterium]|nr:DUF3789 domain-containing protein [Oscillospiraceae bacterium]
MLFIIGCMLGTVIGITITCLCVVAGQADQHMNIKS